MNYYLEHFEVSSHDVDVNNNAKPSTITRMMQETANHHMRDRKPTYYELFAEGKSYILTRMNCQMYEPLNPYDKVDVRTWTGVSRGATFKRYYEIMRGDSEVARAYSEWAVVNHNTGRILKVDEVDFSNYEQGEPLEMTIPSKFRFPNDTEFEYVGNKLITYTDCDMNLHMNNTFYQDVLFSRVTNPQDKIVTGYSIRFMKEAALGRTLDIHRAKAKDTIDDGAGAEESWYFKNLIEGNINTEAIINCKNLKNY